MSSARLVVRHVRLGTNGPDQGIDLSFTLITEEPRSPFGHDYSERPVGLGKIENDGRMTSIFKAKEGEEWFKFTECLPW